MRICGLSPVVGMEGSNYDMTLLLMTLNDLTARHYKMSSCGYFLPRAPRIDGAAAYVHDRVCRFKECESLKYVACLVAHHFQDADSNP